MIGSFRLELQWFRACEVPHFPCQSPHLLQQVGALALNVVEPIGAALLATEHQPQKRNGLLLVVGADVALLHDALVPTKRFELLTSHCHMLTPLSLALLGRALAICGLPVAVAVDEVDLALAGDLRGLVDGHVTVRMGHSRLLDFEQAHFH